MTDERLDYAATGRNRDAILAVLGRVLPERGLVLEIASGSGQHAAHFARHLPGLTWQPTDVEAPALASIAAWTAHEGLANVLPPLRLCTTEPWPIAHADAIFCANMIHIAPWEAALGLVAGAARILGPGAPLVLYGPFREAGRTAPSNEAFDASLRARDASWGVRDVEAVVEAAAGFGLDEIVEMPANNRIVVLRRSD